MDIRSHVLAFALVGCGSPLAQPQDPDTCDLGRRTLSLSHGQLAFDGEATIEVNGASPGETVSFWWTTASEPTCTCSEEIGGCIELDGPEALGAVVADDDGHAALTIDLPPDELVGPRWIQASAPQRVSAVQVGEVSGKLATYLTELDAQYRIAGADIGGVAAGVGDFDGDGRTEVAAGAPVRGAVHVYTPADGVRDGSATHQIESMRGVVTLLGPVGAGAVVASAADVNVDGRADLMIASPDEGAVWLVYGGLAPGVHDLDAVAADVLYGSGIGSALTSADLDGDNRPELVIAAEDRLLMSFNGDLAPEEEILELVDPRVAHGGDLDGDGLDDLVIASGDEVMLYFGPGILEGGLELTGAIVSTLGDLNGDGYDDVQAASPDLMDGMGRVSVVHGPISPLLGVLEGTVEGERVGQRISGAGDVDGDGLADLLASSADGTAMLLYGPAEGTRSAHDADIRIEGSSPTQHLGAALAGPGDLDGDGVDDLIVGATGRGAPGGLYVFRGAPGW